MTAAARMLRRDRATVARALEGVAPEAEGKFGAEWFMPTITKALEDHKRTRAPTDPASRLSTAKAKKAEIELDLLTGELVRRSSVIQMMSDVHRAVRADLLAVPSRAQQQLPHLTKHDISVIDQAIRDAMNDLERLHGAFTIPTAPDQGSESEVETAAEVLEA